MNFDQAFDRLISNEGGYVDDPADPGGETNWGICKKSYPNVDIKSLTRDGAKSLYLRDFWQAGKMDQYDGAIGFQVFDIAVNSGIKEAIVLLQKAAGVDPDGVIGAASVAAIKAHGVPEMLLLINAERLNFWRHLPTWPQFGKEWAGRAVNNLRYAAQDV